MSKTKEQLEKKIEEREYKIIGYTEKNKRDRKKIDGMKPVDGFYLDSDHPQWMRYRKGNKWLFGTDSIGEWDSKVNEGLLFDCTVATPEEVTERLTKFVNGLGFKEGARIVCLSTGSDRVLESNKLDFDLIDGVYYIFMSCLTIWSSKKGWAKIVEEKPKYHVEGHDNGWFNVCKNGEPLESSVGLAKRIETFLNQK